VNEKSEISLKADYLHQMGAINTRNPLIKFKTSSCEMTMKKIFIKF